MLNKIAVIPAAFVISSCGVAVGSPIPSVPDTATRGTQVTVEPYPDPCIIEGKRYDEYEIVYDDTHTGTTEWGFFPCKLIEISTTTTYTSTPVMTLPETK